MNLTEKDLTGLVMTTTVVLAVAYMGYLTRRARRRYEKGLCAYCGEPWGDDPQWTEVGDGEDARVCARCGRRATLRLVLIGLAVAGVALAGVLTFFGGR